MPKKIDYTGHRHGHLTLLKFSRPGGPGVGQFWLARCDCGKIKEVQAKDVYHKKVKTCGKCEYTKELMVTASRKNYGRIDHNKRLLNKRYKQCVKMAIVRSIDWQIDIKDFERLAHSACFYCDAPAPKGLHGVDRLDPKLPYTLDNVQPCCTPCNVSKARRNFPEFLEMCIKIVNNFQRQLGRNLVEPINTIDKPTEPMVG